MDIVAVTKDGTAHRVQYRRPSVALQVAWEHEFNRSWFVVQRATAVAADHARAEAEARRRGEPEPDMPEELAARGSLRVEWMAFFGWWWIRQDGGTQLPFRSWLEQVETFELDVSDELSAEEEGGGLDDTPPGDPPPPREQFGVGPDGELVELPPEPDPAAPDPTRPAALTAPAP